MVRGGRCRWGVGAVGLVLGWVLSGTLARADAEPPVVFRASDRIGPGDVVSLHGGGLAGTEAILVWRLADGNPGPPTSRPLKDLIAPASATRLKAIQASEGSVKCVLPATFQPGVFAVQVAAGRSLGQVRLINRPELWFVQPTILRPGLAVHQLPPGSEIQLVGKGLTVAGDSAPRPRIALRARSGGRVVEIRPSRAEPYSIVAQLPDDLPAGTYELFAHPGKGGPPAWSDPIAVVVREPRKWPSMIFNVRDFGARGNDVDDDTAAIRKTLEAAASKGGGIVYFPWGTYRLTETIVVPARTVLRGEVRDGCLLKWPLDPPRDEKDFLKAAVLIGPECGLEDLTLTARRVDTILLDVQNELNQSKSVPTEGLARIRPWGQGGDIFLRRLLVHHLLLAGRPEQQKEAMANPALHRKYWVGVRNVLIHEGRNLEISDCEFEGGDQYFSNLINGRIVRNSFANHMGYCWTALGGGAIDVVCEGNTIHASSSWGWGWTGMQRVYSAHNVSHNFVRGEREAMTLDISALPTARPVAQYWGTPAEIGTRDGRPFLRFPADQPGSDGFRAAWVPGCFRGGTATIRAFQGGAGAGQWRTILDNTADTVFLDRPFQPAPETRPRPMYLEIAPRHNRAQIGTTAWIGRTAEAEAEAKADSTTFHAENAQWIPDEFQGMAAIILDGKGAGQYRLVTSNSEDRATLDRPWDVPPDGKSLIGVWSLMRHMVVYDSKGTDASAFGQMYGSFYDYTVDRCRVDRSQGIWGQMGWFVTIRDNLLNGASSYHPGIGMRGPNPEHNAPFGYTGLDNHRIRVTKSGALQYPDRKMPLFVDEVVGRPIPSTLGLVLRGNVLRYGHRLVAQPWTGDSAPGPRPGGVIFRDVVVDGNSIEDSAVGVQLGPNVGGAVLSRNAFRNVDRPILRGKTTDVIDLGPADEGEPLFATGGLSGWVEEQHDKFRVRNPGVISTWKLRDGVLSCDGSHGNCGFLRSERVVSDFTLRLRYRMSSGCNSGVCFRIPAPYRGREGDPQPSETGFEVQIRDDQGEGPSLTSTGAIYNVRAPEVNVARAAGEWNDLQIEAQGSRIRVTLNGRTVQDLDQETEPMLRKRPRSGHLAFQNHGFDIEFRDIWLIDRTPPSAGRPRH